MNKRHRAILTALQPATDYAMARKPSVKPSGLQATQRLTEGGAAELMIYGVIGAGGWFDEGVDAASVAAALREIGPGPVNVRLNSPGGDVFDGVAIHSLLARHPGTVTVYVDGVAASAASFIMLAGDHIISARNGYIMIHDAMTMTYGNGDSHREAAELLDKVSDNIADMYAERAGEDAAYWRALMVEKGEDGTWYTGQEALAAGLVDSLTEVRDDFDEPTAVADRLRPWTAMLPRNAREFVSDHPVEEDDEEETTEAEPAEETTEDADMDNALGWAFLAAMSS